MKRLFLIDYRECGVSKHECVEVGCDRMSKDADIVTFCHDYIGVCNDLDVVTEILADMSAKELNTIASRPELLFLPRRYLYINAEEVKRCAAILMREERKQ